MTRRRWDDRTDEALEKEAARWYPELRQTRIADNLVQFSVPSETPEAESFVRCFPSGAVLRRSDPSRMTPTAGVIDVAGLANEVLRLWRYGRSAVPIVLDGYQGPLTVWFALSGFANGLWFPSRPRGLDRQPVGQADYWTKMWPDVPQAMTGEAVAADLLGGLARAFGYRRAGDAVGEAIASAPAALAEP